MSDVSIVNQALALLGEGTITSLDDDNDKAKLAKQMYAPVRDALIQAHNWSFAIKWYNLPKSAEVCDGPYKNIFPLPPEVDRVIWVGSAPQEQYVSQFAVECGGIVSNDSTCVAQTIIQITDPKKFPPLFVQAFATRLAAEMAIGIAASQSLMQSLYQAYEVKLREAVSRDTMQGTSKQITSKWLQRGRFSSGNTAGPYV